MIKIYKQKTNERTKSAFTLSWKCISSQSTGTAFIDNWRREHMLKGQHRFGTKKGSGVGLRAHNDVSNHGIHILWNVIKYECEKARGAHSEKLDLGRKAKKGEEEEFSTSGTRETEVFHLLLQTCYWVFWCSIPAELSDGYQILFYVPYFHLPKDCKGRTQRQKVAQSQSYWTNSRMLYKDEKCLFILLHLVVMMHKRD